MSQLVRALPSDGVLKGFAGEESGSSEGRVLCGGNGHDTGSTLRCSPGGLPACTGAAAPDAATERALAASLRDIQEYEERARRQAQQVPAGAARDMSPLPCITTAPDKRVVVCVLRACVWLVIGVAAEGLGIVPWGAASHAGRPRKHHCAAGAPGKGSAHMRAPGTGGSGSTWRDVWCQWGARQPAGLHAWVRASLLR